MTYTYSRYRKHIICYTKYYFNVSFVYTVSLKLKQNEIVLLFPRSGARLVRHSESVLFPNVLFRASMIPACGYFNCMYKLPRPPDRVSTHEIVLENVHKLFSNEESSKTRSRIEKFTTSILMYQQIMFFMMWHRYAGSAPLVPYYYCKIRNLSSCTDVTF